MSDFLNSIKGDLLDRRVLPFLAFAALALVAALAYVVLGSGSNGATPVGAAATAGTTGSTPSISVSPAPANTKRSVAEVTSGAPDQHAGPTRNPFAPLSKPKTKTTTSAVSAPKSTTTTGASAPSTTGSQGTGTTTTTTAPTPPPAKPKAPRTIYHVAVLFGVAPDPAAQPPLTAPLTPYDNLKRLTPLPSAKQPLIVFRGVTAGGKSATFTVVGETILHGNAVCRPSASQCQAIDLQPGQAEQLEYLPPSGQVVIYELKIVGIVSSKATAAKAASVFHAESKTGRELLRHAGLLTLPGLRYAADKGVIVIGATGNHRAFGARAHTSAQRRHGR